MSSRYAMAVVVTLAMVAGCHNNKKQMTPQQVQRANANLEDARRRYQRAYPDARLGYVTSSNPEYQMVAVGQVTPADFHEGDIVTFVDADDNPLTTGRVLRVMKDELHVRYDAPQPGRRAPRQGDLMIRFKQVS